MDGIHWMPGAAESQTENDFYQIETAETCQNRGVRSGAELFHFYRSVVGVERSGAQVVLGGEGQAGSRPQRKSRRPSGRILFSLHQQKILVRPTPVRTNLSISLHYTHDMRAQIMSAGAIPVFVVRDWIKPFQEHIDWPSFSFTFSPDQVGPRMVDVLRAVSPEQLRLMQVCSFVRWPG